MTTRTLRNSQSLSFLVGIGESLKVVAADGTYTATVTDGVAKGTVLATNATGGTYGPYAYQAQVLLVASASSEIDFDVAVTPVVDTDTQAYCTFDTSGNISGLVSKAGKSVTLSTVLAPVSLSANTTLTRAAHYNRLIVVDVTAGNVTLTATGTDALLGDFISVDVIGGGSNAVTLAGVTGQSGYTLTAITGGTVEAKCDVAGTLLAATQVAGGGSSATASLALVDGDFTANNLNLTATHTNRVLDCSAVTIPVTLTVQTDSAGGYDTTAAELKVLGSLTAPIAIVKGAGATLVGEVQVIEQGGWGGARRAGTDAWAIVGYTKTTSAHFALCTPSYLSIGTLSVVGLSAPLVIDTCQAKNAAAITDGVSAYGPIPRVRYQTQSALANRATGVQSSMSLKLDSVNGGFPVRTTAAIADDLTAASFLSGIASTTSAGALFLSIEPSTYSGSEAIICIGCDSGDTNMQLIYGKGSSGLSKVDLGASFPKSKYVAYELTLYTTHAGTSILAVVKNLNTGVAIVKLITGYTETTPAYSPLICRSSLSNAVYAAIDFISIESGRAV